MVAGPTTVVLGGGRHGRNLKQRGGKCLGFRRERNQMGVVALWRGCATTEEHRQQARWRTAAMVVGEGFHVQRQPEPCGGSAMEGREVRGR